MFIDFQELKQRVSIEQAAQLLGLQTVKSANQLRAPCPMCRTADLRALAITPSKGLFFCFSSQSGGDCIKLAAHVLNIEQKDAAKELARMAGIVTTVPTVQNSTVAKPVPSTSPQSEAAQGLKALDYLEPQHEAVAAIGFDTEVAASIGLGWASKGMMRGTVAIPIRDERGVLLGYVGITEARLPPSFQGKVVQLHPKKTA